MQKLKDLLEHVREQPAKHENRECFLSCEFPVIWYIRQTTRAHGTTINCTTMWCHQVVAVAHKDQLLYDLLH